MGAALFVAHYDGASGCFLSDLTICVVVGMIFISYSQMNKLKTKNITLLFYLINVLTDMVNLLYKLLILSAHIKFITFYTNRLLILGAFANQYCKMLTLLPEVQ